LQLLELLCSIAERGIYRNFLQIERVGHGIPRVIVMPLLNVHYGNTIMKLICQAKNWFRLNSLFLWLAKSKWFHNRREKGNESEVLNELDFKMEPRGQARACTPKYVTVRRRGPPKTIPTYAPGRRSASVRRRQGFGGSSAVERNPPKHSRFIVAIVTSRVTHSSSDAIVHGYGRRRPRPRPWSPA